LSALGIGVITFQFIFGQELHWSVPGLTFIILVAVGADYNLLLISRIRDESPHGVRFGVIRTVIRPAGSSPQRSDFRRFDVRTAVRTGRWSRRGVSLLRLGCFALLPGPTVPRLLGRSPTKHGDAVCGRTRRHHQFVGRASNATNRAGRAKTPSASEQLSLDLPSNSRSRTSKRRNRPAAVMTPPVELTVPDDAEPDACGDRQTGS